MRFRPISVWPSATPGVAESNKINTQSACLRQLIMEVVHFTSHKQRANVLGNYVCKRYTNLFARRIRSGHANKSHAHNQEGLETRNNFKGGFRQLNQLLL